MVYDADQLGGMCWCDSLTVCGPPALPGRENPGRKRPLNAQELLCRALFGEALPLPKSFFVPCPGEKTHGGCHGSAETTVVSTERP